jgi:pyruvate dehydrogenase phosphatase
MGDFTYKWPLDKIKKTGLTRAFGPHVIPPFYYTPPYLTCDPEITQMSLKKDETTGDRYIILSTDGLWEQFETSRDVVQQVFEHRDTEDDMKWPDGKTETEAHDISATVECTSKDKNGSTHLLRYALGQNPSVLDPHLDAWDQCRQEHTRLNTFLTLPVSVVRNFRDDISVIIIQLR